MNLHELPLTIPANLTKVLQAYAGGQTIRLIEFAIDEERLELYADDGQEGKNITLTVMRADAAAIIEVNAPLEEPIEEPNQIGLMQDLLAIAKQIPFERTKFNI